MVEMGLQLQDINICQPSGRGCGFLTLHEVVDLHLRASQLGMPWQCRGHNRQPGHNGSECLDE